MFSQPVTASPSQTRVAAQIACMNTAKAMIIHPEYYGQTRSGLDIWICAETGSGSRVFSMFDPGPYAVIACNMVECRIIDWTY